MRKSKETTGLVRAALYIRVSGEEQKIKGLSLEAYAKERGWLITGIYIDAAKTARKNIHKRAEFQRMIESVKRDEVDVLLFCRLDRWFQSVADYYKVMEIHAMNAAISLLDIEQIIIAITRCNQHFHRGRCTHNRNIREEAIEDWLFSNLAAELERCKLDWEVKAAKKKKRALSGTDKATIKA